MNKLSKISSYENIGTHSNKEIPISASNSTAINNEIKAFERIKKKQEMELVTMIQAEMIAEFQKKENEEKIRKQQEKQDRHDKLKEVKRKAEIEKQLQIQRDKVQAEKEAEIERKNNDLKKYMKEQKFMKEEMERHRQKEIQLRLKQEKDAKHQELLKQKTEAIFENQQKLLEEKQKMMEDREEERRENLEKKRLQQLVLNREKSEKQQRIIQTTMKNLEEKLHNTEVWFHNKQEQKNERLRNYEELRRIAFEKNKEKSMKKAEDINRVIEKNREQELEKLELYYQKQAEIGKRKAILDEQNKVEKQKKIDHNKAQDKKIQSVLKHNEVLMEDRKNNIVFKIVKTEKIVLYIFNHFNRKTI